MSKPVRMWLMVVMAVTMIAGIDYSSTANSDYGLGLLNTIMETDPSLLCFYVSCQEPVPSSACPDKTIYIENTSQFGCCGACVAFRQINEPCTGNIDPMYGEGYTRDTRTPSVDFLESLYNISENNVVQSSWCDYDLTCATSNRKCGRAPSVKNCRSVLEHYLSDIQDPSAFKLYRDDYRWKPVCTLDGKFDAKQCIGPLERQRCVCVDPDGNRLFGSAFPEQEELFNTMNCKCSRQVWEKQQAGQSVVTLHCLENGNFEPLQCEDEWCYCVDPTTAELYGSRLPENAMHMLPCYNKTTVGEQYLRRCESELYAHTKVVEALAESGTKGPQETLTSCDQDGSYASWQCDQESCRCWDKYHYQIIMTTTSGDNCKCIDDQKYYKESGVLITVVCEVSSGVYAEEQVIGKKKFCVDEDGIRSGPLVKNSDEYTLSCENAAWCQENGATIMGTKYPCFETCLASDQSSCPDEAYTLYEA